MYAIGHTSHKLISLSNSATKKVVECKKKTKKNFGNGAFYRKIIKNEVWSFFEEYEQAKGFQFILFAHGSQS